MKINELAIKKNYWKPVVILCIGIIYFPWNLKAQVPEDIKKINSLMQRGKPDTVTLNKLLKMADSFLEKEGSYANDIKTSQYIAQQVEALSYRMNDSIGFGLTQLLFAKIYRKLGNREDGRIASEKAVRLLTLYGDSLEKARAIIELGGTYSNNSKDIPIKIRLYKEAARIIGEQGDKLSEAKTKEFIGDLLQVNRQYTESLEVLNDALKLYQDAHYDRLHGLYSLMGETYHGLNNFVESLKYNLLALETGERLNDRGLLMEAIYNRVGLNYYTVRYYDHARGNFDKALSLARINADTPTIKTMLLNISSCLAITKQHVTSLDSLTMAMNYGPSSEEGEKYQIEILYLKNYIALNNLDKAQIHFDKLLQYYKTSFFNETVKQLSRIYIVFYLQAKGKFSESVAYLEEYKRYTEKVPISLAMQAEGEYYAFRTDSALGNFTSAIDHYRSFKTYSDSLNNTAQARQMGILQLQFQTEQKDKNIELLTQQSQLQEASLQNEKIFRNVFVAGVCMLLVFSALMYNRYRLKKKLALRLESQQNKINEQNKALTRLVEDKEWLLKEIHHRVKNNLQIVISLLNTQSKYLDNEAAVAAIKNSQHRMYAMSLIHQRLYQTDNLGKIDMNWYINELIRYMKESFDTEGNISFNADIDAISLDVIQAVPVGLILNEAVSNSIKYAFPPGRKGVISIGLKSGSRNCCQLYIRDNGVGFRDGNDSGLSDSLGMSLMQGLSDQLEGEFSLGSSDSGVFIKVVFQCRSIESKQVTTEE